MKKVLSLIFVMALFIAACGDGGDVFNKKSSADEEPPVLNPDINLPLITTINPKILEFFKMCPTAISCMPAGRLDGIRAAMQFYQMQEDAQEELTANSQEEIVLKPGIFGASWVNTVMAF